MVVLMLMYRTCSGLVSPTHLSLWPTAYNGHTDCLRLLLQYSQIDSALDCTDAEER